jgi:hypothetical protein
VKRTGDVGMDLPAGLSASALSATDYHPVDMEPEDKVRPSLMGISLPAGRSSAQLAPEDYQTIETEQGEG